jgi:hypothetical protein
MRREHHDGGRFVGNKAYVEHPRRDAQRHRHAVGLRETAPEKAPAEAIARKVNGVKSVRNEIAVRP